MQMDVALYGTARVIIGQPHVNVTFDTPTITLGQILEKLINNYPRVRPYLLDEAGMLPFFIRVLINDTRPDPDATLATILHDGDRLALLVAVAGGENSSPSNTTTTYFSANANTSSIIPYSTASA